MVLMYEFIYIVCNLYLNGALLVPSSTHIELAKRMINRFPKVMFHAVNLCRVAGVLARWLPGAFLFLFCSSVCTAVSVWVNCLSVCIDVSVAVNCLSMCITVAIAVNFSSGCVVSVYVNCSSVCIAVSVGVN